MNSNRTSWRAREQRLDDWQKFVSKEIKTLLESSTASMGAFLVLSWFFGLPSNGRNTSQDILPLNPGWVTEKVVLALIAASTAQLGAIAFGIGKSLFTTPPDINHR
ncbi:MAG: hypothetical protein WDN49_09700 [Acetobacteraceae bacterium]